MACGHGKLWWKGAGRLGMREGCREARDRARAAPRARAFSATWRLIWTVWNPATATGFSVFNRAYKIGRIELPCCFFANSAMWLLPRHSR